MSTSFDWRYTPVALAVFACSSLSQAQVAQNTTSADVLEAKSPFETGGQATIGPRPFTSFLDRLSSPVNKIQLKPAADNLLADGITGTPVTITLLDSKGQQLAGETEITIEVNNGARVLLPGQLTSESGADKGDIDKIQPGVQAKVKNGQLEFKLIAPYKPEAVTVRVTVRGVSEKVVVRYVPDLREMIAVGLVEGRMRSDKFDPSTIVPARENDGFDQELRGYTKDFNGGKTQFGARSAFYLKGKVQGQYLLTAAYDSDKITHQRLFNEIDPNAFYPVYGDSSIKGVDAQSSGRLYVRIDQNRSYLLWGDYNTADPNPARSLSQYSRTMPGLRGHYEEGNWTVNAFAAQDTYRQIVDEFPGRGVSGPYSVSNPNGVAGTEKIDLIVRRKDRPTEILKITTQARFSDYEFEPFSGQILFRAPIPSIDDQGNPVSIRVTYEVDQGGQTYMVSGADAKLQLSPTLTLGVAAAKDQNPAAPFEVQGINVHLKLSKTTEIIAELARTNSVVNTGTSGFNTNTSNNFAGVSGQVTGQAMRAEIRHNDENLRGRAYVVKTDNDFNNASGGIAGGKQDLGVSAGYKVNKTVSVAGEFSRSDDHINNTRADAMSASVALKLTDRLTVDVGARHVRQDSYTLVSQTPGACSNGSATTNTGYNNGYGISQTGNQQIDPATGLPVVCANSSLSSTAPVTSVLDRSSLFTRAAWRATDTVTLTGEAQRELGEDSTNLYKLGADWRVADRTRIYGRYENSRSFGGAYGLGLGTTANQFALGVDTQYMQDGSLYSEYRLRDGTSGKDVQSAVGLRNGWRLAEGLRLNTNAERIAATTGNSTALGAGLEYTANPLWKGSTRYEWRQDTNNANNLITLALARKIDRNWTLLFRDYWSSVTPRTAAGSDTRQNRAQIGFAYRPVDNNKFDALGLFERKKDDDYVAGSYTHTDIISLRANYHPSRPWWLSGRYAFKRVTDTLPDGGYTANLLGSRVMYDITNRWSVGGLFTVLQGTGGSRQYAYGLEAGYILVDNVWVTLGYNWRGFVDKDLTATDYTNRGWVLGMRYKFDETLFGSNDPTVNKTLTPAASGASTSTAGKP